MRFPDPQTLARVLHETLAPFVAQASNTPVMAWGDLGEWGREANIAAASAVVRALLDGGPTPAQLALINAVPHEQLPSVPLFMARGFVCEDCGRRNYCDLIEVDDENVPPELQAYAAAEKAAKGEMLRQAAAEQGIEVDPGVVPGGCWVKEPDEVRCAWCAARFRNVCDEQQPPQEDSPA